MSINANNNKETFKLLDVSSESESDFLKVELQPRRKRVIRTRRNRHNASRTNEDSHIVCNERWGPRAVVFAACTALLAWLAALSWAAASLAADTHRLDLTLRDVSIGSQNVGDALQRCHSVAKELLQNHTEMAARLEQLVLRTDNLTSQVNILHDGLEEVKRQVAGAPQLVAVPQRLDELQKSVATFGSQIKDMDSTVQGLKAQTNTNEDLHQNVTLLKNQVDTLWNKSLTIEVHNEDQYLKEQNEVKASLAQLVTNVSQVNETLAAKITWATQDYKEDHHKVMNLMDSVQNNSAALSSLQTAWRQSNDFITKNITELTRKLDEKSAELQRQLNELGELRKQLDISRQQQEQQNEQQVMSSIGREGVSNSAALTGAPPPVNPNNLHERREVYSVPQVLMTNSATQQPTINNKELPSLPSHSATSKPKVLSSSST